MELQEKKKVEPEAGSREYQSFGDIALRPGFSWEYTAKHAAVAFFLCGLLLHMPPRRGRHGPILPMPPLQLFFARTFLVAGLGAVALKLAVREEVEVDPEVGEVQRMRRIVAVEQQVGHWRREDLVAVSVECARARGQGGGLEVPKAWYRAVFVARTGTTVPFTPWAWLDLLGTNTLAEEMARRMELPVIPGETLATARLHGGPGEPVVTMEPATERQDYVSPVHWTYWALGGAYLLISTVAKAQVGGF